MPGGLEDPTLSLVYEQSELNALLEVSVTDPQRTDIGGIGRIRLSPPEGEPAFLGDGARLMAYFPAVTLPAGAALLLRAEAVSAAGEVTALACTGNCDCFDDDGCETDPVRVLPGRSAETSTAPWNVNVGFSLENGAPAPPEVLDGARLSRVVFELLWAAQGESISFANDYVMLFPIGVPQP
ncbi:MAG: hypothetical protein HYV63_09685 [Candidatus Schekmanbacteria bacterium]|nr:hypothetical protein [Candidatus Schekmanbacteria bacterium]